MGLKGLSLRQLPRRLLRLMVLHFTPPAASPYPSPLPIERRQLVRYRLLQWRQHTQQQLLRPWPPPLFPVAKITFLRRTQQPAPKTRLKNRKREWGEEAEERYEQEQQQQKQWNTISQQHGRQQLQQDVCEMALERENEDVHYTVLENTEEAGVKAEGAGAIEGATLTEGAAKTALTDINPAVKIGLTQTGEAPSRTAPAAAGRICKSRKLVGRRNWRLAHDASAENARATSDSNNVFCSRDSNNKSGTDCSGVDGSAVGAAPSECRGRRGRRMFISKFGGREIEREAEKDFAHSDGYLKRHFQESFFFVPPHWKAPSLWPARFPLPPTPPPPAAVGSVADAGTTSLCTAATTKNKNSSEHLHCRNSLYPFTKIGCSLIPLYRKDSLPFTSSPSGEVPVSGNCGSSFNSPDTAPSASAIVRSTGPVLRVHALGHGSFLLQCLGMNILTDPILSSHAGPWGCLGVPRVSQAAVSLDSLPHIDAVLISSLRYDAYDYATVRQLCKRDGSTLFVPEGAYSRRYFSPKVFGSVYPMRWGDRVKFDYLTVCFTPSIHAAVGRYLWDYGLPAYGGFILQWSTSQHTFCESTIHTEHPSTGHPGREHPDTKPPLSHNIRRQNSVSFVKGGGDLAAIGQTKSLSEQLQAAHDLENQQAQQYIRRGWWEDQQQQQRDRQQQDTQKTGTQVSQPQFTVQQKTVYYAGRTAYSTRLFNMVRDAASNDKKRLATQARQEAEWRVNAMQQHRKYLLQTASLQKQEELLLLLPFALNTHATTASNSQQQQQAYQEAQHQRTRTQPLKKEQQCLQQLHKPAEEKENGSFVFDLAILPIGGYEPRPYMRRYQMNPEEAVNAHLCLRSRVSVASHFDVFPMGSEDFGEAPQRMREYCTQQCVSTSYDASDEETDDSHCSLSPGVGDQTNGSRGTVLKSSTAKRHAEAHRLPQHACNSESLRALLRQKGSNDTLSSRISTSNNNSAKINSISSPTSGTSSASISAYAGGTTRSACVSGSYIVDSCKSSTLSSSTATYTRSSDTNAWLSGTGETEVVYENERDCATAAATEHLEKRVSEERASFKLACGDAAVAHAQAREEKPSGGFIGVAEGLKRCVTSHGQKNGVMLALRPGEYIFVN